MSQEQPDPKRKAVELTASTAAADAPAAGIDTELVERCKKAPRYGVNAKFLLLQAASSIRSSEDFSFAPFSKPKNSGATATAAGHRRRNSGATAAGGAAGASGKQRQDGPVDWQRLPVNLRSVVPADECPFVEYRYRQKVPRNARQAVADKLAGQFLSMLAAGRGALTREEAEDLIRGHEELREAARKASLAQELRLYLDSTSRLDYQARTGVSTASAQHLEIPTAPESNIGSREPADGKAEAAEAAAGEAGVDDETAAEEEDGMTRLGSNEDPQADDENRAEAKAQGEEREEDGGKEKEDRLQGTERRGGSLVSCPEAPKAAASAAIAATAEAAAASAGAKAATAADGDESNEPDGGAASAGKTTDRHGPTAASEAASGQDQAAEAGSGRSRGDEAGLRAHGEATRAAAADGGGGGRGGGGGGGGGGTSSSRSSLDKEASAEPGNRSQKLKAPGELLMSAERGGGVREQREHEEARDHLHDDDMEAGGGHHHQPHNHQVKHQVVAFIRCILDPFFKSRAIDKEAYKTILQKASTKVMAAHPESQDTSFLIVESEKIHKLVKAYLMQQQQQQQQHQPHEHRHHQQQKQKPQQQRPQLKPQPQQQKPQPQQQTPQQEEDQLHHHQKQQPRHEHRHKDQHQPPHQPPHQPHHHQHRKLQHGKDDSGSADGTGAAEGSKAPVTR